MLPIDSVINKNNLQTLGEIAGSVGKTEDIQDKFAEIEHYLTDYIDKYKNTNDVAKLKKVAAATKLLPAVKRGGLYYTFRSDMNTVHRSVEREIRNIQDDEDPVVYARNVGEITSSFDKIDNSQAKDLENAWTVFMEEDNFEEYHKNSPLSILAETVKTCSGVAEAYKNVEANILRDNFKRGADSKDPQFVESAQNATKQTEFLHIYYDGDLDLAKTKEDITAKEERIKELTDEITKLRADYDEEIQKEEKANNLVPKYAKELNELERQLDNQKNSSIHGDDRKKANADKEKYRKELTTLLKAYNDIQDAQKNNSPFNPFELERTKAQAYEDAKKSLSDTEKANNEELFIADLLKNEPEGKEKEALKTTLKDAFDFYHVNRKEENKWTSVLEDVHSYVNTFRDDPEIMNYLIAEDDEVSMAGYEKLLAKYGEKDRPLYDLALNLKRRITKTIDDDRAFANHFDYDGKSDQKEFIKELEKKILLKVDLYTAGRSEFPLEKALNGYLETKKESYKKTLTDKGVPDLEKNPQLAANLKEYLKKIKTYADKRAAAKGSDIENAEKNERNAKHFAKRTKEYATNLKNAIQAVKDSGQIEKYPELKDFVTILEKEDQDFSKLPKDAKFLDTALKEYNEAVEQSLKDSVKNLEVRVDDMKKKFDQSKADALDHESKALMKRITEDSVELDKLQKEKTKLQHKETNITNVVNGFRESSNELFQNFENGYNALPTRKKQDVYERIYREIELLKADFDKCRRDDYINGSKSNSTEYDNIKKALEIFGTKEQFLNTPNDVLAAKLNVLAETAQTYKAEKLREIRPMWSHQRRYRLGYADRIMAFAKDGKNTVESVLKKTDEESLLTELAEKKANIDEKSPIGKENGDVFKHFADAVSEKTKEDAQMLKRQEQKLDEKMDLVLNKAINEGVDRDDFITAFIIIDQMQILKENLRNPDLLAKYSVEQICKDCNKTIPKLQNICENIYSDPKKNAIYKYMADNVSKDEIENCKKASDWLKIKDLKIAEIREKKLYEKRMAPVAGEKKAGDEHYKTFDNPNLKKGPAAHKPSPKGFQM